MNILGILKAIIPLLLLAGLLYGIMLLVKKQGFSFKNKLNGGSLNIKLVSTQMIMPKKFISVVRIEDKLLILGISEQAITVLKELEASSIRSDEIYHGPDKEHFLKLLKKNLGFK